MKYNVNPLPFSIPPISVELRGELLEEGYTSEQLDQVQQWFLSIDNGEASPFQGKEPQWVWEIAKRGQQRRDDILEGNRELPFLEYACTYFASCLSEIYPENSHEGYLDAEEIDPLIFLEATSAATWAACGSIQDKSLITEHLQKLIRDVDESIRTLEAEQH